MKRLLFLLLLSAVSYAQTPNDVDFLFTVDQSAADEAAGTLPARVVIVNNAAATLDQVELLLNHGTGEPVVTDPSWTCRPWSETIPTISCRHAPIPPQSQVTLDFTIRYGGPGRHLQGAALVAQYVPGERWSIHKQIPTVMWRSFVVRNTNDSGAGSLRDTIATMNADPACAQNPCRITFAMDGLTINVLSPLPRVTINDVEIDGTTQPDTNPLGPDVEILGSGLVEGNGLEVQATSAAVRGLAIGYFPGNGIEFHAPRDWSQIFVENNYIGVDATGSHARINLGRGITIHPAVVTGFIRNNVISGNHRSGIFVDTLQSIGYPTGTMITISNNRIGVAVHSDAPIPNGASGVFIGPRAEQVLVERNVIAHNAHFGVSIATGSRNISVNSNRMFRNALLGIDIALDGPSGPMIDSRNAVPTLVSARYDAATNTTTITGRGHGPANNAYFTVRYELFANETVDADGYAETEVLLGTALPSDERGNFTFTVQGDLRGKYISAVGTQMRNLDGSLLYNTSEISRAVRVE